ncbi:hypothetical protein BGZ65_012073, partial [Modicella reniformis]
LRELEKERWQHEDQKERVRQEREDKKEKEKQERKDRKEKQEKIKREHELKMLKGRTALTLIDKKDSKVDGQAFNEWIKSLTRKRSHYRIHRGRGTCKEEYNTWRLHKPNPQVDTLLQRKNPSGLGTAPSA